MARIASISKSRQIAAYFDELQAALMTGLYDPTMLAEDSTLARLEKTLADHRDHRGQTGISLLRSHPSGLAEAEGLLPHAVRFFRWTASFLWSQTAPQGPFQSGDEVGAPRGRPVWVLRRIASISSTTPAASRYSRHAAG